MSLFPSGERYQAVGILLRSMPTPTPKPVASICGPSTKPVGFEPALAEAAAYEGFRANFKRRYPKSEVMAQYEYLDRFDFSGSGGSRILLKQMPQVTAVLDAMATDFRRSSRWGDFRRPDGIGLAELPRGVHVELLEVTTRA